MIDWKGGTRNAGGRSSRTVALLVINPTIVSMIDLVIVPNWMEMEVGIRLLSFAHGGVNQLDYEKRCRVSSR
ncbi:hypothetical protein P152DRAFT_462122, partial [Eremomyces bilateralis CBS 781.70]